MTAVALAPAQTEPQTLKKTRISKRLQEAIRLLCLPECKTQRAAAQKLGMSETYLSEALRKPEIRVFIERTARENVAVSQLRASARLGELLDCESLAVNMDATKLSLAIAGIKPAADAQVSVNIDIKAGYVIDLTDSVKPALTSHALPITIDNEHG